MTRLVPLGLAVATLNRSSRVLLAAAAVAFGGALVGAAFAPGLGVEAVLMLPVGFASTAFLANSGFQGCRL